VISPEDKKKVLEEDACLWWDSAHRRLRYSVEYAQQGVRALFLANGGAIIALLTFAGNSKAVNEPRALFWSFIWFGSGLALSLATYIVAYISQAEVMQDEFIYSRHARMAALDLAADYEPSVHNHRAILAERIGVGAAVLALSFFVIGAFVGLDAIT